MGWRVRWGVGPLAILILAGCSDRSGGQLPDAAAPESTETGSEAPRPGAGEWVAVLSAEGGFSVELPRQPVQEERTISTELGPRPAVFLRAQVDAATSYNVAYADYSDVVLELEPDAVLEGVVQGATAEVPGTVESTTRLAVDGHPAVDYIIAVPGGTLQARAVLAGQRLYVLQRAAVELDPGAFARFVDSFAVSSIEPRRS